MKSYRDTIFHINNTRIVECLLMISIIIGCRSVFVQAYPYFGYTMIIITSILSIIDVAVRKGAILSKRSCSIILIYIIMATIVSIFMGNTRNGPFVFSYWILVPLMLLYFLLLTYQEKIDWLKRFSNLIFVFIILSTISWLIGPILHWIQPIHTINVVWGGNKTYYGYCMCYISYESKLKSYLGISFPSNSSIFVEAPVTNVIYALGYVLNTFLKGDKSKLKEGIYVFAMLTTMSVTSIILAVLIFAVNRIMSYRANPSKSPFLFLFRRIILPIAFLAVACIGIIVVLGVKMSDDYGNFYAHTYAITSGYRSWLTKPIIGYGYELGQQFYNTTSGFFKILVHGGIVFASFYVIPFLATLYTARKRKDYGLAAFGLITFILLVAVIWHYSPAYMFVLAYEFSFMLYEKKEDTTVEGATNYNYDTIKTGSQKIYRG